MTSTEKILLSKICTTQIELIKNNEKHSQIQEEIIGDGLQGKVKLKEGKYVVSDDKAVNDLITGWYSMANSIHFKILSSCNYVVYRGAKLINTDHDEIKLFPIPVSTSKNIENLANWIGYDDRVPIVILFTSDTYFTCLNNPDEGEEIILPAGILKIVSKQEKSYNIWDKDTNIPTYICHFTPKNTIEEMVEMHKEYGIKSVWNPI
jgi:hypothetical protein